MLHTGFEPVPSKRGRELESPALDHSANATKINIT